MFLFLVITHLQPSTSCEGIENLIQSSGPCSVMMLDSLCNTAFCSTTDWSVMLLFQACDKQGMLSLTDKSNGASAKVSFGSDPQVQELNHTLGNVSDTASMSTRIVSSAQMFYYLVSLDAPLFNISFPMTAIPLQCPHNTGIYLLHINTINITEEDLSKSKHHYSYYYTTYLRFCSSGFSN